VSVLKFTASGCMHYTTTHSVGNATARPPPFVKIPFGGQLKVLVKVGHSEVDYLGFCVFHPFFCLASVWQFFLRMFYFWGETKKHLISL